MKKEYQQPDVEYISLTAKAIPLSGRDPLVDFIEGEEGVESSIF